MSTPPLTLRVADLCERVSLDEPEVREIVACGILTPRGHAAHEAAHEWEFEPEATALAARALRLHRDLHLDWPGVALALQLLQEIDALRRENQLLRQRLTRHES